MQMDLLWPIFGVNAVIIGGLLGTCWALGVRPVIYSFDDLNQFTLKVNDLKGAYSLLSAMAILAYKDNDIEFFKSPEGQGLCTLLQLNGKRLVKKMEEQDKLSTKKRRGIFLHNEKGGKKK